MGFGSILHKADIYHDLIKNSGLDLSKQMHMRITAPLLAFLLFSSFTNWETNFSKALQSAKTEHKYVLLNFSGSDWCGPCIKLHHDYFESDAFKSFATEKLVLVNADFPRQKKNQLSKEMQKQNNHLADLYNATGSFPLTILLTPDGQVLKAWEGVPKVTVDDFIEDIKNTLSEPR
jgi:thioredoxin-related protein